MPQTDSNSKHNPVLSEGGFGHSPEPSIRRPIISDDAAAPTNRPLIPQAFEATNRSLHVRSFETWELLKEFDWAEIVRGLGQLAHDLNRPRLSFRLSECHHAISNEVKPWTATCYSRLQSLQARFGIEGVVAAFRDHATREGLRQIDKLLLVALVAGKDDPREAAPRCFR